MLSTTNTEAAFGQSLINCTVINTTPTSGVIPEIMMSMNCILVGSVMSSNYSPYLPLGVATNYSSQALSLYCKYNQSITFRDPSANDYRLSWSDTAAKAQGIYTGSYFEDIVDVDLQKRIIRSSYGADEACVEYVENLHGSDVAQLAKRVIDSLRGTDSLQSRRVVEDLYCIPEKIYRGTLSGRILVTVQKKMLRLYRI
jgi:hypothetical protein